MSLKFARALKDAHAIGIMAEIDHPDGVARVWSGIGTLDYDGYEWRGLGILGGVQTAPRTVEIRVDEVVMSLSGVDPAILNDITYEIRDRVATTYLIILDDWQRVVARRLIDIILLDYMIDVIDEGGSSRLELHGEAGFWTLTLPSKRSYSPNDQKLIYPDDTGCDYVPLMENKETKWTPT